MGNGSRREKYFKWVGELRECIFCLAPGGLEGMCFLVKRALEVKFVGLGVSHV